MSVSISYEWSPCADSPTLFWVNFVLRWKLVMEGSRLTHLVSPLLLNRSLWFQITFRFRWQIPNHSAVELNLDPLYCRCPFLGSIWEAPVNLSCSFLMELWTIRSFFTSWNNEIFYSNWSGNLIRTPFISEMNLPLASSHIPQAYDVCKQPNISNAE